MLEVLAFMQAAPGGFSPISSLDFLMPPLQDLAKGGVALVASMEQKPIYTTTDPSWTYTNGAVLDKYATTQAIAYAALAVAVALVGLLLILRSHGGRSSEDLRELVPRIAFGTALLLAMPLLIAEAIDTNNAMCAALGSDPIAQLMPVNLTDDVGGQLLVLLFVLAYLVLNFLLLFGMYMRLALLDPFIVLAPLAAVLFILPITQHYARLWTRFFVATVFGQFLMLSALRLATALPSGLMETDNSAGGAILGIVAGIAELLVARRMLSFLASEGLTGGGGGGALAGLAMAAAGMLLNRGGAGALAPAAAAGGTTITEIASSVGSGWGSMAPRGEAMPVTSAAPQGLPAPQTQRAAV